MRKAYLVFYEFSDYDSHDKRIIMASFDEGKASQLCQLMKDCTEEANKLAKRANSLLEFVRVPFDEPEPKKDMRIHASSVPLFSHPDKEIRRRAVKEWNTYTHTFKEKVYAPWRERYDAYYAEQAKLFNLHNQQCFDQALKECLIEGDSRKEKILEIYNAGWESMAADYCVETIEIEK